MITKILYIIFLYTLTAAIAEPSHAAGKWQYDSSDLRIRLTPRSPQQIAAFYEARGFDAAMLNEIKKFCFITVYIRNKGRHVIWHDLNSWRFTSNDKELKRIARKLFKKRWESMHIPLAHQSTFRWTLLPEQLDFRPNEGEGGNIVLPWTDQMISVRADFKVTDKNSGKSILVEIKDISCQK